jgi:hypothetical protein
VKVKATVVAVAEHRSTSLVCLLFGLMQYTTVEQNNQGEVGVSQSFKMD